MWKVLDKCESPYGLPGHGFPLSKVGRLDRWVFWAHGDTNSSEFCLCVSGHQAWLCPSGTLAHQQQRGSCEALPLVCSGFESYPLHLFWASHSASLSPGLHLYKMQLVIMGSAGQHRLALDTADLLLLAVGHLAEKRASGGEGADRQPHCATLTSPCDCQEGGRETVPHGGSLASTTVRE